MHRLFGGLLRLYSHVTSTGQQCVGTGASSDQVAGPSQLSTVLPLWNESVLPPPGRHPATNLPMSSASIEPPSSVILPVDTDPLPFTPSEVNRYDKSPTTTQTSKSYKIQPVKRDYSDTEPTENWLATVHPEGALYFHDGTRGVYTDSDMHNETLRRDINLRIDELLGFAKTRYGLNMIDSGEIELVVQLRKSDRFQYYFVDHLNRSLFWVHECDGEELFDGVRGVDKTSHIRYAVEQRYWQVHHLTHCEMYPNDKLLRPALLMELREVVIHASAETITTDLSLSPFDGDELSKILDLIDRLREPDGTAQEGCKSHSVCVVARFMCYFTRARFFNFYGLPNARLNADQSIYAKGERGRLMLVLSWTFNVALFGAPNSHMRELRSVWVDRTINVSRWKDFNSKLNGEWSGITIYSTVMLAVDVSFLAVPTVMPSTSPPQLPPQVVTTYISVFCIVGSLVTSLILTGQNRHQESADRAVDFLMKTTGSMFGTKALATVHGLPYAMLLWGMVFFMASFSYQVFTSTSTIELATTGSACGLMMLFVLWLVQAAKDFHVSTWLISWFQEHFSRSEA